MSLSKEEEQLWEPDEDKEAVVEAEVAWAVSAEVQAVTAYARTAARRPRTSEACPATNGNAPSAAPR